jgi:hypothetical protein
MPTCTATRHLLVLFPLCMIAATAQATWSIVVTTEPPARCRRRCDLSVEVRSQEGLAGHAGRIGGAAAQSALDGNGVNRRTIWDELKKGTAPVDILAILAQQDPQHQMRQYGIADMLGRSVSFSGSQDGSYAGQAYGSSGTLAYAIQGNVLTGSPVIEKAKAALLETDGDLATRVIAAMLAARDMGGDGRCSCSFTQPTRCGSPPDHFEKAAHVGYFVISRIGDTDGDCNKDVGCVNGNYYLDINVILGSGDPDPVYVMAKEVEEWRTALIGRPDHVLSRAKIDPPRSPRMEPRRRPSPSNCATSRTIRSSTAASPCRSRTTPPAPTAARLDP